MENEKVLGIVCSFANLTVNEQLGLLDDLHTYAMDKLPADKLLKITILCQKQEVCEHGSK